METLLEREKQVKQTAPRRLLEPEPGQIPAWTLPLVIWLALFYLELYLFLGNGTPLTASTALYVAVFSASGAAVMTLLATIGRREKTNFGILFGLLAVLSVYFGIQYFCKLFFSNYMSLASLFTGTKGVVGGFFGVVLSLIARKWWMVVLLLIPLAAVLILRRGQVISLAPYTKRQRIAAAVLAVVLLLLGRLLVRLNESAEIRYNANYEFDTAATTFGMGAATRLDLTYLVIGGSSQGFQYDPPAEDPPAEDPPAPEDPVEPVDPAEPVEPTEPVEPAEPVVEYGDNALDIDFAALAEAESNSSVANIHSYVASLSPSPQNAYTGLFAGKNLILISAEAFSAEAIDPELTPTLYRLYTKGIRFTNYYQPAWGGSTSTGEFSNMTGLIPTRGVASMQLTANCDMYFTLGNQLMRQDYFSRAYHPHTYTYYDRHLTHENLGYEKYIGYGNGLEDRITPVWPESDLELMEATVDEYINCQPFSIYYMTVSGHAAYTWVGNSMSSKNRDAVADLDAPEIIKGYMAASIELDRGLAYLIERLEAAGIADDTVIVMGTDHYPYGLETEPSENHRNALGDLYGYDYTTPWERDHSALIIWSGCLEDEESIVVDTPVYSLDIVPTVSNLMGLPYDSRLLVGRDVFSDATPLVIWPNYSWMTDKATYNAATGEYTVQPGSEAEVDEAYLAEIRRAVSNRFFFSQNVLDLDYYRIVENALS